MWEPLGREGSGGPAQGQDMSFRVRLPGASSLHCVTLGRSLHLSDPQVPHQSNEENTICRAVRVEGDSAWEEPGLVPGMEQARVLSWLLL